MQTLKNIYLRLDVLQNRFGFRVAPASWYCCCACAVFGSLIVAAHASTRSGARSSMR